MLLKLVFYCVLARLLCLKRTMRSEDAHTTGQLASTVGFKIKITWFEANLNYMHFQKVSLFHRIAWKP